MSGAPVSVKVSEKSGNYFFIGQNIPQKCKGFEKENRSIDDLQKKAGLKANGNCFHYRTHFLGLRTAVSGLRKVTITHNFWFFQVRIIWFYRLYVLQAEEVSK